MTKPFCCEIPVAAAVVLFIITSSAYADPCKTDAALLSYKPIKSNNYLFTFSVSSDQCTKYSCNGYVSFSVTYHYPNALSTSEQHFVARYHIDSGHSKTNIAHEESISYVGANIEIDAVLVTEASCTTP